MENLAALADRLRSGMNNFPLDAGKPGNSYRYPFVIVLMAVALAVRLLIAPVSEGLQYLTFFPAVTLAAIVAGYGAGMLATAIGLIFATIIFTPPYYVISFANFKTSMWSNLVFLLDGTIVSFSIEAMHRYRRQYQNKLLAARASEQRVIELNRELARFVIDLKQAEEQLRVAAATFEVHEGIMITDANCVIIRVNQAFTEITGYPAEEAIGQTPRLLKSGRHDKEFYRAMWECIHRTGSWDGEIWDRRKNGEVYPKWMTITAIKEADGQVSHYVSIHTDITARKAAEEEIRNLAFFDPLTQLPNRRLLLDRLQQAIASNSRSGKNGALLFVDLDNFKSLNDSLGHDMGDLLLQQVAQRLLGCVREGDTVARLGGDEFVVMLKGLHENVVEAAAQTEAVGEKILSALNLPYRLAFHEYHGTPSLGATLFNQHRSEIEDLFKQADIAMYQAKKCGRNALRFFDPRMQDSIDLRVALERDLRKAIENLQFQLYCQIQVDNSGHPYGAEALIRWLHPERGLVSPAQFISLAEETGLILPIGQWVMDTACAQIKAWEKDETMRNLILSVNVSAKQFHRPDFVAQIQSTVQRHAINPDRLKLELTESMLLETVDETIASMQALKATGIRFALDDFGTGYSSLQYLKRLPLNQLKIDQSFIRDLADNDDDKAIVGAIIAMAHSLNLNVIAEGVETEEQRKFLVEKGCPYFQGYLFGRPVPIQEFEPLLKMAANGASSASPGIPGTP